MDTVTRTAFLAKEEVQRAVSRLRDELGKALPVGSFAEREAAMLVICGEVGRTLIEQELQAISDGIAERVFVNGEEYRLHESGTGTYWSLVGPAEIRRSTYRKVGVRNGATVVPLELIAGVIEGATPALSYDVAQGYAEHDMRTHGRQLESAYRVPPPRATLERLAKRLGAAAQQAVPKLEPVLRQLEVLPEGAHGLVLGLDRTSVPMAEQRDANAPKKVTKRSKPRVRRAPAPIDVNYRMAYVGTVSVVDEHGQALVTRRYAAAACDDPAGLVRRMTSDVRAALRRNAELSVGVVQDGAPEMWNVMRGGLSLLKRDGVLAGWFEGIDRYHLLERLAAALEITESGPMERKRLLDSWKEQFDMQDWTIDAIERYLTERYRELPVERQRLLWEHLVYIANNKDRMRYVSLAVAGLPCGSGVTESAAKTVVNRRAKNSGQRWSADGLRNVLTLRAALQSDRLPRFWTYFSRRYTAAVEAA
jgi:hypothetical protein